MEVKKIFLQFMILNLSNKIAVSKLVPSISYAFLPERCQHLCSFGDGFDKLNTLVVSKS